MEVVSHSWVVNTDFGGRQPDTALYQASLLMLFYLDLPRKLHEVGSIIIPALLMSTWKLREGK